MPVSILMQFASCHKMIATAPTLNPHMTMSKAKERREAERKVPVIGSSPSIKELNYSQKPTTLPANLLMSQVLVVHTQTNHWQSGMGLPQLV